MRAFGRSLRGRLTIAIVALLTGALVLTGIATAVIASSAMHAMVDDQLDSSLHSLSSTVDRQHEPRPGRPDRPPKPLVEYTSQASGTAIAVLRDGRVADSAVFTDDGPLPLSPDVVAALESRTWVDGERFELDLPGLGAHLVESRTNEHGDTLVAAVALDVERAVVGQTGLAIFVVGALALIGAALATIFIVRRATRPLTLVAETADRVSATPLDRGEVGEMPRVDAQGTDPDSETGRVVGALNRMLEHVDGALATREATDRRMRQFVTDASHELRTPLAAIQGYAELTRQESDVLPPVTETALARIEAEAARMSGLVHDLLLLARLDEGHGGLAADPVDLGHLVLTALDDARTVAPGHEWRADVPDEAVNALGDQSAITQILANLLRNAHTHAPEGTVVTVRIRRRTTGMVELVVADDGPGVDPAFEPKMFQRFARHDASRSRSTGSTGLGLAIVAALAEAQGGSVRYVPGGAGATFEVLLPAAD